MEKQIALSSFSLKLSFLLVFIPLVLSESKIFVENCKILYDPKYFSNSTFVSIAYNQRNKFDFHLTFEVELLQNLRFLFVSSGKNF